MARPRTMTKDVEREREIVCAYVCACVRKSVCERERKTGVGVKWR